MLAPTKIQVGDSYTIEAVMDINIFNLVQLQCINMCRTFLKAIIFSYIATGNGESIGGMKSTSMLILNTNQTQMVKLNIV